jgi:hypothetical protein
MRARFVRSNNFRHQTAHSAVMMVASLFCVLPTCFLATSVEAQEYGGIEIGAKGIKRVVGTIGPNGNFEPVPSFEQSENVSLSGGLEGEGNEKQFREDILGAAAEVIANFIKDFESRKVQRKNIFVAVSSGLAGAAGAKDGESNAALNQLKAKVKEVTELEAHVIAGDREAWLTFEGLVTTNDQSSTFVIDVGGGNTKLAGADKKLARVVNYGSNSFAKKYADAEKPGGLEPIRKELEAAIASMHVRGIKKVYVSGGIAFVLAVLKDPVDVTKKKRGTVALSLGDIQAWRDKFNDQNMTKATLFDKLIEVNKNNGDVAETLRTAKNVYDMEQLRAGRWLLEELVRLVSQDEKVTVAFNGKGQTAWLEGFIKASAKPPKPSPTPGGSDAIKQTLKEGLEPLGRLTELLAELRNIKETLAQAAKGDPMLREQVAMLGRQLKSTEQVLERGLKELPSRQDFRELERSLGERLDRIATAIERNRPPIDPVVNSAQGMRLYNEGVVAFRKRQPEIALDCFRRSVGYDPTNATVWYFRAVVELQSGDEPSANRSLQHVAQLVGNHREKYATLCRNLEIVQGPERRRAEELLLANRRQVLMTDSIQQVSAVKSADLNR